VATDRRGHLRDTASHPGSEESTALGAAICAGVGVGLWNDIAQAAALVAAFERTVQPDLEASAAYRALADEWFKIYAALWSSRNLGSHARCGARPAPDQPK